ncbi:MAG: spore coat protein [Eubacterium sp.]|nr:spore coat protein [Eubacterium sp.]MBQ8981482.1 spore coat protein [Eubacterium sp.]MBR1532542.1 spore coat protein [Eubacterium sp.]
MNDRNLMQDILLLEKGACDLYMHGTIESSSQNINQVFKTALNSSLTMQDDIYKKMESKGWYQTEQAQQTQIDTLKQKFTQ